MKGTREFSGSTKTSFNATLPSLISGSCQEAPVPAVTTCSSNSSTKLGSSISYASVTVIVIVSLFRVD